MVANRKAVLGIVAVAVVVGGFLMIRDPVGAAAAVRGAWDVLLTAVSAVFRSLTTFFQHLFEG
ncbi:hypothetical protein [Saccharopolyspora cebuensis]|uniref:Uncharacterized protein n=1 Tax=Saccharopolyspora cebuensis TaxID=418759 RepID=A0ABV4CCX2_9PSEU